MKKKRSEDMPGLDVEARRLLDDHKAQFVHESCVICRSLRRTILRAVPK